MPNRDPFIATSLRLQISELSQNEIDALNRQLDAAIAIVEQNNDLYDQYAQTWIGAREQVSDINDYITDLKVKKINAQKAKDNADKAVKTQEVVEKVNTISMSLNPVAAALQFAAKILKTELEHELKGLQDITAIINPSIDNFTRFAGGVLIATGETVEGDLNRKIREMEERIAAKKKLRQDRIDKLFERRKNRRNRIKEAQERLASTPDTAQEEESKNKNNSEEKLKENTEVNLQGQSGEAGQNTDITELNIEENVSEEAMDNYTTEEDTGLTASAGQDGTGNSSTSTSIPAGVQQEAIELYYSEGGGGFIGPVLPSNNQNDNQDSVNVSDLFADDEG